MTALQSSTMAEMKRYENYPGDGIAAGVIAGRLPGLVNEYKLEGWLSTPEAMAEELMRFLEDS